MGGGGGGGGGGRMSVGVYGRGHDTSQLNPCTYEFDFLPGIIDSFAYPDLC